MPSRRATVRHMSQPRTADSHVAKKEGYNKISVTNMPFLQQRTATSTRPFPITESSSRKKDGNKPTKPAGDSRACCGPTTLFSSSPAPTDGQERRQKASSPP